MSAAEEQKILPKKPILEELRDEGREKTLGYIVGALSLVAGLAWNDAVKSLIEHFFPVNSNSVWVKLLYAVAVTAGVVIVTVYLSRLFRKDRS